MPAQNYIHRSRLVSTGFAGVRSTEYNVAPMEPESSITDKVVFRSGIAYERKRIHAAAIYCSDGRMGEQFDDFLQSGLKLPRYDRVALPGGPACLADHQQSHVQTQGVVDELKFLIEVHELKRIVLLAHEGCAFYATRLELRDRRLELLQQADLIRAAAFVRRITGVDVVEAYFARLGDDGVAFEVVEV